MGLVSDLQSVQRDAVDANPLWYSTECQNVVEAG